MASSTDSLAPERGLRAPFFERNLPGPATLLSDIELVLRRHAVRGREENDQAKIAEGTNQPARAAAPGPSVAMTQWQTIPANRYEQFKKELASQGTIESETPLTNQERESLFKSDHLLTIKVTILPVLQNEPPR